MKIPYKLTDTDKHSASIFEQSEFDTITSLRTIVSKTWKFINRIDYFGKNFVYAYSFQPEYSQYLFDIYKLNGYYVLDKPFFGTYRYDDIEEMLFDIENDY